MKINIAGTHGKTETKIVNCAILKLNQRNERIAEKEAKARIKINKLLEEPVLNVAAKPAHSYSKK